jgi:hypothetical protein
MVGSRAMPKIVLDRCNDAEVRLTPGNKSFFSNVMMTVFYLSGLRIAEPTMRRMKFAQIRDVTRSSGYRERSRYELARLKTKGYFGYPKTCHKTMIEGNLKAF